ncbi:hypothetical protein [Haloglomus litoreum]|uniref:hypothetical protein n=1 Tax=Haloglomus litoreum TaxID=3034026 RepID=UPI0023E8E731|nr:hypothetical protein [Haloglomus sp. DT116]
MCRAARIALVACLVLAGCGGLGGSTPDCTTTPSPTPRAEPPVYVVIDNEDVSTHSLEIRATHLRENGSRAVLFDSTVGLAPTQHLETRATVPSRDGRYRVRATVGNVTGRETFTVPDGRLRQVRVHIVVNRSDASDPVAIDATVQRPTPAC